jgi:hypothetical protein
MSISRHFAANAMIGFTATEKMPENRDGLLTFSIFIAA